MPDAAPDLQAVTQIQQQVWSQGDFAKIGDRGADGRRGALRGGRRAAGTAGPRRRLRRAATGRSPPRAGYGDAVGLDYVPALLERGRERAAAEGYDIEFVEGDAQALPFEDASFDVVLSTFGAMFAPDQEKTAAGAAAGLPLRAARSAWRTGRPRGLVGGGMFKTIAEHAPPPPGRPAARALGDRGPAPRAVRRRRLGAAARRARRASSATTRRSSGSSTSGPTSGR